MKILNCLVVVKNIQLTKVWARPYSTCFLNLFKRWVEELYKRSHPFVQDDLRKSSFFYWSLRSFHSGWMERKRRGEVIRHREARSSFDFNAPHITYINYKSFDWPLIKLRVFTKSKSIQLSKNGALYISKWFLTLMTWTPKNVFAFSRHNLDFLGVSLLLNN